MIDFVPMSCNVHSLGTILFSMANREMFAPVAMGTECHTVLKLVKTKRKKNMSVYTDSVLSGTTWNKKSLLNILISLK